MTVAASKNEQERGLFAKPPPDGKADPAESRLRTKHFPFWKGGRPGRQVATSRDAAYTHLPMLHARIRFVSSVWG